MKATYLMISLLCFLGLSSMAQTNKSTPAKPDKVTVYMQGAHLYYKENVTVKAGYNEFVFDNISPIINAQSLQAHSSGGMVMDVRYRLKYKEKVKQPQLYDVAIQKINDSIEDVDFTLREIQYKLQVLGEEKRLLLNHHLIKNGSSKDSLQLLKESMNYLREKLNNIYEQEVKWQRAQQKTNKQKQHLQNRLNTLYQLKEDGENPNDLEVKPIHQVMITLYSEESGPASIYFNYFIHQASWNPIYDLSASSTKNGLQLKYMANVQQNSGINWTGVPLTLSTSNPSESNVKPELSPWYISLNQVYRKQQVQYGYSNAQVPIADADVMSEIVRTNSAPTRKAEVKSLSVDDYTTITENILRMEYEIKLQYNIESDNQPHRVVVTEKEVPMQLQFAAVPKLCTDAFLLANVTGWEDLNIIPGAARIYFDGMYVGEVLLNTGNIGDTLAINLGRDKGIIVQRKKVKDKTKVKFLDDEKVETRTIEITVRNTKSMSVELMIEDVVPIAPNQPDIKVTLVNQDRAEHEESTGKLKWQIKLGSKETKKISFTYEVRYPKNKVVYGL